MPSDIMDQRHMASFYRSPVPSSFLSEEMRFPSEKQVGFWKTASAPDHRRLEATSFMSGGKADASSPLEKFRPIGGNFGDCLELPHGLFRDLKRNDPHNFERQLMVTESTTNCRRDCNQNLSSLSNFYGQPASLSGETKKFTLNGGGYYENGLFSSSMTDIFNKKLRLSSNDVMVGQSKPSNLAAEEAFESLEEIEAQTIGDLLPDDDDLLSGAIHSQFNKADVEEDVFCSIGGLELETDENFSCNTAERDYGGAFNGHIRGSDNYLGSETFYAEQPTRSLFVKNIDSNIEDVELRYFFEQYGDVRTLHTSCKLRGYIMVTYYDIRAAQNAKRVLETKSITGQKVDIQFCIPKLQDNPSGKDISDGLLLVTNLDFSVTDADLHNIFGAYGEIKKIYEIPSQRHNKFVEFYDARAAEAALLALNQCDIAGKQIKVQSYSTRGGKFGLMQQLTMDLEDKDQNRWSQEKKFSSECFAPSEMTTLGSNTSSGLQNGCIQGMHAAFQTQKRPSLESKSRGLYSSMPHNLSPSVRVSMAGNLSDQSANPELSQSFGKMNFGLQGKSTFSRFKDATISGIPFSSPNTISPISLSAGATLTNGIDRIGHGVGPGSHISHSFEQNESVFNVPGGARSGVHPLHRQEYIWDNSNTYQRHHSNPAMWQNLSPLMNNFLAQSPLVHGVNRGPSHMANQPIGSAPGLEHLLWNRRQSFNADAASFHPSSFGSMGYSSCPPLNLLELPSRNMFPHANGTCLDPAVSPVHVGVPSPQQRGHILRARNTVNSACNSYDSPNDRIRGRRGDSSANSQAESRKQYELDIERIVRGEDCRTTLMIKNIPNKYTSKMLLATIDEQHKGTYDFIYLPIDFKNKCNVGYAFINMTDPQHIIPFYQAFNGKKWEKFNSEKVAYLAYARIQGKSALIAHFQNSSLMNEDKRCRPIIFHSEGPNAGDQEPFPVGVNIRCRRSRTNTENHQGSPSGSSSGEEPTGTTGDSLSGPSKRGPSEL